MGTRTNSFAPNSGVSLVELMVVLGVMGITALMMGQLFSSQFKSSRSIELRASARDLIEDITSILANNNNCLATLQGLNPNGTATSPTTFTQIRQDNDNAPGSTTPCSTATGSCTIRYATTQTYGFGSITLSALELRTTGANPALPTIPANGQGSVELTTRWTLGAPGTVIPGNILAVPRRLTVNLNASSQVVSCSSSLNNQQIANYVCQTLGGTWNGTTNNASGSQGVCMGLTLIGPLTIRPATTGTGANATLGVNTGVLTIGGVGLTLSTGNLIVNGGNLNMGSDRTINLSGANSAINLNP